jgi:DNA invertase Pin-like site-specific DNA recombinase
MTKSTSKSVALYCRSAVPNEQSIQKQQENLTCYAKEHGIAKYKFYIDNGFSGNSFERPNLKQLINDVKDGKISVVVVADESRLSRNFEQYSELKRLFEENGISYSVF